MIDLTVAVLLFTVLFPPWNSGFRRLNGEWLPGSQYDSRNVRAFLLTGPSLQASRNVSLAGGFPVRFGWRIDVARLLVEISLILSLGFVLVRFTKT